MSPLYKNALSQYRYHWKSALFSSLGIIIASMALVISGHLMRMATDAAANQFKNLGLNTLTIMLFTQEEITPHDINTTLAYIPHLKHAYPMMSSQFNIDEHTITIIGSTAHAQKTFQYEMTEGRMLHPNDVNPYAVVTKDFADTASLKLHQQVLGNEGVIEVIGLSEKYELPMRYYSPNGFIFVSLDTFTTLFPNANIETVMIEVDDFKNVDMVATAAKAALETQYPDVNISVMNPSQVIKMTEMSTMMVNGLIYLVVGICAILGGIGIMNMTIANITTRYTELALRVSFGATLQQIQKMLIVETSILCSASSLLGSILGVLGVKILAYCMSWDFVFIPATFFNSQAFSIMVGVIASLYPSFIVKKIPIADILKGK